MKKVLILTVLLIASFSFSQKKKTKKSYKPKTTKIVKKEVPPISEIPAPVEAPATAIDIPPTARPNRDLDYDVTKTAEYPGGTEAFRKYIATNIVFPSDLTRSLKIIIQFIVEKDGSTSNLKIQYYNTVSETTKQDLEKNINSLLAKSKKWIPGTKNDTPVRSQYRMPMTFQLE